ncbi:MAG: 3-phosphoserine/phosphohydroxythreonine transaminase [Chloroflexales bacterium]|nr:3-phosphoserine/phosphohydroxythreonine transaminase [Chloroflexales bacterium]
MSRVYNFNPGPAALPLPVLERAQQELLDYQGQGMSILEMSHRSKEYEALNARAEERIKALLGIDDSYRVLFIPGGASLQFAMVPMNFLPASAVADYILTGAWAEKAFGEAKKIGQVHIAASTQTENYHRIPDTSAIKLSDRPAYVHITSNNTIYGTQWQQYPDVGDYPLVADMSSDILSRPFDASKFALIYAGTQKNIGSAGVTAIIIRQSWLDQASTVIPTILRYTTFAKNNSLYNTPPTFSVYLMSLVLEWIEDQGGVAAIDRINRQKAAVVYTAVERSGGFYHGHAQPESRSLMNATFRLPSEDLEKQFISEAKAASMVGLGGHRSVGGIRVSLYNGVSREACEALAAFMDEFMRKNG